MESLNKIRKTTTTTLPRPKKLPYSLSNIYKDGREPRKQKTHKVKLKKQSEGNIIKNVKSLFRVSKENEAIKR